MRVLTDPPLIGREISRLISTYKNSYVAVAWAGRRFDCCDLLLTYRKNIKRMIVGIHFYQTHPDFMREFVGATNVRFIMQPSGVFHPKLYFFENSPEEWECVIGSPNFTAAAFTNNSEVAVLVSHKDLGAGPCRDEIMRALETYWGEGKVLTQPDLESYAGYWARQQKRLEKVSGQYGSSGKPKSPLEVDILKMSWEAYINKIRGTDARELEGRIRVLDEARNLFGSHAHFNEMGLPARKGIAGFMEYNLPWKWFGSMQGAGIFKHQVNDNSVHISTALDHIALSGDIGRDNFDEYIRLFLRAFPQGGGALATATRLLAMKRPDYFICVDSRNRRELCKAFGIGMNLGFEDYWDEVVERITDSVWWNAPKPADRFEVEIWQGRAAFLDALYYDHSV